MIIYNYYICHGCCVRGKAYKVYSNCCSRVWRGDPPLLAFIIQTQTTTTMCCDVQVMFVWVRYIVL